MTVLIRAIAIAFIAVAVFLVFMRDMADHEKDSLALRDKCETFSPPYDQVVGACSRLLSDDTIDGDKKLDFRLWRAHAYRNLGNTDLSLFDVNSVLEADPGYSQALILRGYLNVDAGQDDAAISDLSKALELDNGKTQTMRHRAEVYFLVGEKELSLKEYQRALERDPFNEKTASNVASVLIELGRVDEAIKFLKGLNEKWPSNPVFYYALGRIYSDHTNSAEEALFAFSKSASLDPKLSVTHFYPAVVYLRAGNIEEGQRLVEEYADKVYSREIQSEPFQYKLLRYLGMTKVRDNSAKFLYRVKAYAHSGNLDMAVSELYSLESQFGDPFRVEVISRISSGDDAVIESAETEIDKKNFINQFKTHFEYVKNMSQF
ncbi:hypothetical protein [uncultured Ruegeria sp.]|uniref:tetratricopeptide repeat protein n=1 Tax=uncultured Ruegeria sp. TaxID=259304 RepID=UPI00262DC8C6|nr:hypothetical protein [uncultured Ruegeria sp.]